MFISGKSRIMVIFISLCVASEAAALSIGEVVGKVESNYRNIISFTGNFNQAATLKTLNKVQQATGEISYKRINEYNKATRETKVINKFLWKYDSPTEQEVISDGKTVWLYFPENRQVYIYDLTNTFEQEISNSGQIPGDFLSGLTDMKKDFNVKWGTPRDLDEKGNFIIELTPKKPMVNVRNIFLVIPRELFEPSGRRPPDTAIEGMSCEYDGSPCSGTRLFPILSSTVYDTYGNMTQIEFIEIEVLEAVDETNNAKKRAWTLPEAMFTFNPPGNIEIIKAPLTRGK